MLVLVFAARRNRAGSRTMTRPAPTRKVPIMTESKLNDTTHWLWNYLKNEQKRCGNRIRPESATVYGDGIQAGHSGMTIRNASDKLKVVKSKIGKLWYWSLPEGCEAPKLAALPKPPVRKPKRRPRRVVITISFE